MRGETRTAGAAVTAWLGLGLALSVAGCDGRWATVQEYVAVDTAWHEAQRQGPSEDGEPLGPHPDIGAAVAAARGIVAEDGHPQRAAAAEFLMEHPYGLSETYREDIALGTSVLAGIVGSDWDVLTDYRDSYAAYAQRREEIAESAVDSDARREAREALGDPPKALRAAAVAMALVRGGDADADRLREAAGFLVSEARFPGSGAVMLPGLEMLAERFQHYEDWPTALRNAHRGRDEALDAFVQKMAAEADVPLVRATARYYAAAGLRRDTDIAPASERPPLLERALQFAEGLSEGVAEAEFVETLTDANGDPQVATMAQAEAELVYSIKYTTVGATLPEVVGARLDGTEQSLSAFAGKVVLIDFWATWCPPCVAALPKLRELVEEQPPERFALLSISVDDEVEEVTAFQADEPMPWPNWHADIKGEIVRTWDVSAYPTYVLVDGRGVILARTHELSDSLLGLIRDAASTAERRG
jgi:thiol-disulfide isomerase/thioredoxin